MQQNAISLANYFVDLALSNQKDIFHIGLMKRVYIAHGFCLAVLDRSALDPRFDVVEAWKHGPVIPSVYHSFKHNGNNKITVKSFFVTEIRSDGIETETPLLKDDSIRKIADFVWRRYIDFTDFELVELTHRPGTPWALCYVDGKTNPIPDIYTKTFYKKLLKP